MRTLPFLGKGVAFPFRLNSATGGVEVTTGYPDDLSVGLAYLIDAWTIREDLSPMANHIAESIAHILLTRPTEHDTLPEFGSKLFTLLFEPNTPMFGEEAAHWFKYSTKRWEKRAAVPEKSGVQWFFSGTLIDQGIAPVNVRIEFIVEQVAGNSVAPFSTPRQARIQEYKSRTIDTSGHDDKSRYLNSDQVDRDGVTFNRFQRAGLYPPRRDDQFYKIRLGDTWLLIAWRIYGDIRYWPYVAQMYLEDQAAQGASRDILDVCPDPIPGDTLRVPSTARLLMEIAA